MDAVENDPDCETNFKENLNLNHMDNNIHYYHRDVLTWNKQDYDIILANINRNVIEELIPKLQTSKGTILLSGLLETDYDEVKKLCQQHNLKVKEKIIKGEWICINILSN